MAKEILIVDGDKAEEKEFKNIFKATDYNLVFSDNGAQVLLRLDIFKPDLIIIGESLKEKSGLEVFKAIKERPESKQIPVILLSDILKGMSKEDHLRFQVDGIITPPFQGDKIINLVDRLIEKKEINKMQESIIDSDLKEKSAIKKEPMRFEGREEFLLDSQGDEEEEEIIDLVDVVEEAEVKMSIQDFTGLGKETPITEITPLESWEKLIEEEKPIDRRLKYAPDEKEKEAKGLSIQLGEEDGLRKEVSEKELFEKIELEEIIKKVEQLAPEIEKEWPPEMKREIPGGLGKVQEVKERVSEGVLPKMEEPSEKETSFAEFEAALKRGLMETPTEEVQPSYMKKSFKEPDREIKRETKEMRVEKPKEEVPREAPPKEVSLKEETKGAEEFPEITLEEMEEEIKVIEEPEKEEVELFEELEVSEVEEVSKVEKEEIEPFEELEEERIELFEEGETPEIPKEEINIFEEVPQEEGFDLFEELEVQEKGEIEPLKEPEEEKIELFEEIGTPEAKKEEVKLFERPLKEERIELFKELEAPEVEKKKMDEQRMEEIITRGVQEVMEGWVTKLIPEITRSIIHLTLEQIERMVKEIVPDLAEKMIQDEIRKLQKGEKG